MKKDKKKRDTGLEKGTGSETWLSDKNTKGSEPGSKPTDKDRPEETWLNEKKRKIKKK